MHALLESERGEITSGEQEVVKSLQEHEVLFATVDAEFQERWSLGERLFKHRSSCESEPTRGKRSHSISARLSSELEGGAGGSPSP